MSTLITATFSNSTVNAQTPINAIEVEGKLFVVAGQPSKQQAARLWLNAIKPNARLVSHKGNQVVVAVDGYISEPWIDTNIANVVLPTTIAPNGKLNGQDVYYIASCGRFVYGNGQALTSTEIANIER